MSSNCPTFPDDLQAGAQNPYLSELLIDAKDYTK